MHLDLILGNSARALAIAIIFLTLQQVCVSSDAPAKMTHVIIQMSGTDIPEDSFFTKPKTFWRASNGYCRSAEEPDPANGIHGRLIINEPDAWLVNLADGTAKHIVDHGPTFNCRLPIFALDEAMVKGKVGELEIGRELDFFHANGAKVVDGPKLEFEAK